MSGWNTWLVSWFVSSTGHVTAFHRSLKLNVFSYDSQKSVTEITAHSHFPVTCNSLPQQNNAVLPHCYWYHQTNQFLLYIWKHIRFLNPTLTINTITNANLAARICQYISVCSSVAPIRWFSLISISENKHTAHQTTEDYDYEDSSLPGCDTTSVGEWLPKFQINCFHHWWLKQ
jgi:hypothetical protein